jgi:hypothetical protein
MADIVKPSTHSCLKKYCRNHEESSVTIREGDRRTWCKPFEPLLYFRYKFSSVGWRSCPKYQTVPWIDKPGLDGGVFKPLKD